MITTLVTLMTNVYCIKSPHELELVDLICRGQRKRSSKKVFIIKEEYYSGLLKQITAAFFIGQ